MTSLFWIISVTFDFLHDRRICHIYLHYNSERVNQPSHFCCQFLLSSIRIATFRNITTNGLFSDNRPVSLVRTPRLKSPLPKSFPQTISVPLSYCIYTTALLDSAFTPLYQRIDTGRVNPFRFPVLSASPDAPHLSFLTIS